MSEHTKETFGARLGMRLDALDAELAVFDPRKIESLIALRRQVEFVRQDAAAAGAQEIVDLANRADGARALDARQLTEELLTAMRAYALKCRNDHHADNGLFDPGTGLMKREAFAQLFTELTHRHAHVAVAAVSLTNAPQVRNEHGNAAAAQLNTHVAATLARIVRSQDSVASFEPDHFTIFLPGEDARGLESALKRIQTALLKHPFTMPDGTIEKLAVAISGRLLDRDNADHAALATEKQLVIGILSPSVPTTRALEARLRAEGFEAHIANTTGAPRTTLFHDRSLDAVLVDAPVDELESLVQKLRAFMISRRAPILALVRTADEGHRALAAAASEFLTRPLDLDAALVTIRRLTQRGHDVQTAGSPRHGRLLIASTDLYPLISIGTAMQRHVGCEVLLGRGSRDAIEQFKRHDPATVLIDLRLEHMETHNFLKALAEAPQTPDIILIIEEYERAPASMIETPRIHGAIVKPVHLLGLAEEVKKSTSLIPVTDAHAAAARFKSEMTRVMAPAPEH